MQLVISSGHGKYVSGAVGILNEVDEARRVVARVAQFLTAANVGVKTFNDDVSRTQNENLKRIVDYHNSQTRDLDVSVHFNSYQNTTKPMGTECLYVTQAELSAKVAKGIASATALPDRGAKKRTDLYFLNNTAKPAILVEVCFVDSSADATAYNAHFDDVCRSIAESVSGQAIGPSPEPSPPEPEPEPEPEPLPPPKSQRPTTRKGDTGEQVVTIQSCLMMANEVDGDFGSKTETAVKDYQRRRNLDPDGVVGPQTWSALEADYTLPPWPTPMAPWFQKETIDSICEIAMRSPIARYNWRDRGMSPPGYTKGMAVAFAYVHRAYLLGDSSAKAMAKANTHNSDKDALAWYAGKFADLGMDNSVDGPDTLRHLFVLQMGLGMRESSGRYCEGRDMSATNTSATTAEAGLFQMSWNASSCSSEMQKLFDQYSVLNEGDPIGGESIFKEGVSCSSSEWSNYGSGDGAEYQWMAKNLPTFAVQTTAVGLRNIRQHWGPINRYEAELRREADEMLAEVQQLVTPPSV